MCVLATWGEESSSCATVLHTNLKLTLEDDSLMQGDAEAGVATHFTVCLKLFHFFQVDIIKLCRKVLAVDNKSLYFDVKTCHKFYKLSEDKKMEPDCVAASFCLFQAGSVEMLFTRIAQISSPPFL